MIIKPTDALQMFVHQVIAHPDIPVEIERDLVIAFDTCYNHDTPAIAEITVDDIYGEDLPSSPVMRTDDPPSWEQWAEYWANCTDAVEWHRTTYMMNLDTRYRRYCSDPHRAESASRTWVYEIYQFNHHTHTTQAACQILCDIAHLCDRLDQIREDHDSHTPHSL